MSPRKRGAGERTDGHFHVAVNGAPGVQDEGAASEEPGAGGAIELANEYAVVRVRKVRTGNGVRLEIDAPRLGRRIRLCPLELESLTWQSHEVFSEFLETPFGPEHERT